MVEYYASKEDWPGVDRRTDFHSDLEVAEPPTFSKLPEAIPHSSLCPVTGGYNDEKIVKSPVDGDTDKIAYNEGSKFVIGKKRACVSRKKLYWIIAIIVLVIIAIVVGSVVGVLKSREQTKTTNTENNGPENLQDGDATDGRRNLVWNQTKLAVTGWRFNDEQDFSMRLFYQDEEGNLRVSTMNSTKEDAWNQGTAFAKAKRGTPLAAACNNQSIYEPKQSAMETHLFYLDEDSVLREHVFRDYDDVGFSGRLSALNVTPANDTQLASYWPFVAYQNPDKTFSEMRYNCSNNQINCWSGENLKIAGPGPSSAIAMVPTARYMNGTFFFYEREDGQLVHTIWDNSTDTWNSRGEPLDFPRAQPLAVMAMPQKADGKYLNFHALYQKPDQGGLFWLWKSAGRWKAAAKPAVMAGAMKGTSIACLTQASWFDKQLVHDDAMSRCYFFGSQGRLRSVHRTGSDWKDLGKVGGVGAQ